jgi:hypothetical protein
LNLFIPSTYLFISPIISFGDWYNIVYDLPGLWGWRVALIVAGALACWLSFRIGRPELGKLVGSGGSSSQSTIKEFIAPAYIAGGW